MTPTRLGRWRSKRLLSGGSQPGAGLRISAHVTGCLSAPSIRPPDPRIIGYQDKCYYKHRSLPLIAPHSIRPAGCLFLPEKPRERDDGVESVKIQNKGLNLLLWIGRRLGMVMTTGWGNRSRCSPLYRPSGVHADFSKQNLSKPVWDQSHRPHPQKPSKWAHVAESKGP